MSDHIIQWSVDLPDRTSYTLTIGSGYMAERIINSLLDQNLSMADMATAPASISGMGGLHLLAQWLEQLAIRELKSGGTWTMRDLSTGEIHISCQKAS